MTRTGWIVAIAQSVALAVVLGLILVRSAPLDEARTAFDEIDVHRINVREPDGTLRLVISNHASLPGIIVEGEERPFNRPQAGMLFYNDDASETGGLIFGGHRNDREEVEDSGVSLSFDRYGANQIVQLIGVHDRNDRIAGLVVSDSDPDEGGHRRIWVGSGDDGAARIELRDGAGRSRIVLEVAEGGGASLAFLDGEGKVVRRLAPVD